MTLAAGDQPSFPPIMALAKKMRLTQCMACCQPDLGAGRGPWNSGSYCCYYLCLLILCISRKSLKHCHQKLASQGWRKPQRSLNASHFREGPAQGPLSYAPQASPEGIALPGSHSPSLSSPQPWSHSVSVSQASLGLGAFRSPYLLQGVRQCSSAPGFRFLPAQNHVGLPDLAGMDVGRG